MDPLSNHFINMNDGTEAATTFGLQLNLQATPPLTLVPDVTPDVIQLGETAPSQRLCQREQLFPRLVLPE